MTVYWVRHGQTDSNRERVVQTPDTPLSSLGHQQAQLLANAYKNADIGLILCSDHMRTQQTAAPLHEALNCQIEYTELLQERSFGALRGQPYDSIQEDFFAKDYHPPQGESHPQFVKRVFDAWDLVLNKSTKTQSDVLVMTHGLVLRVILAEILGLKETEIQRLGFENTCVTSISKTSPWQTRLLCNVDHLDCLSDPESVEQGAV
ncbi:MAG: histidine phosphatase family protein [Aliiglaciecola sp.]